MPELVSGLREANEMRSAEVFFGAFWAKVIPQQGFLYSLSRVCVENS